MKKRTAVLGAIIASLTLAFAAPAMASVDSNIAGTVKRVEGGIPKWVVINGTHTASSGYFTGYECANGWVDDSANTTTWWFQAIIINLTGNYWSNGSGVHFTGQYTSSKC